MTLVDNKLQVAKLRLTYIITFVIGSILLLYSFFSNSPVTERMISTIIGLVLFGVFIYLLFIKPEYTFFSIEKNTKLIVRNYTALPIFRKYKAFEVPLAIIHSYELKKSFANQRVFIRIAVKSKGKIGKYPWLSLSAVSKNDVTKLLSTLDKITRSGIGKQ